VEHDNLPTPLQQSNINNLLQYDAHYEEKYNLDQYFSNIFCSQNNLLQSQEMHSVDHQGRNLVVCISFDHANTVTVDISRYESAAATVLPAPPVKFV